MLNNLRSLRIFKGINQSKISEMVGINTFTYQNYEYCKREPKVSVALKLAKILGTNVEELFLLTDQEK